MTLRTIAGPLKSRAEAQATADQIDKLQCSVYSREVDGVDFFFVEQDTSIQPEKLFGYSASEFMARQYKGRK